MNDTTAGNAVASSRAKNRPRGAHGVQGGTSDVNRLAIAILEVLAGERTPAEAAAAVGVSVPRYYQLETRALEGFVGALAPRSTGPHPSLQAQVKHLEKDLQQTRREAARQQALVRAAQRSLGLKPPAAPTDKAEAKDRAGRRKRRPVVRALKAAAALAKNVRSQPSDALQQETTAAGGAEGPPVKECLVEGASG